MVFRAAMSRPFLRIRPEGDGVMGQKMISPECRNDRQIVLKVDRRIWAEVCEFFPTTGVRKDIAAKHTTCCLIIAAKLLSLLRSDNKTFSLNLAIMDRMESVSHRKRKAINKYLHSSRYFEIETHHSAGHHSTIWTVRGVSMRREVDQDNMRHDDDGSLMTIIDDDSCAHVLDDSRENGLAS